MNRHPMMMGRPPPTARFQSNAGFSPSTGAGGSDHLTKFEQVLDAAGLLRGDSSIVYKRAALISLALSGLVFAGCPSLVYDSKTHDVHYKTFLGLPLGVFLLSFLFI